MQLHLLLSAVAQVGHRDERVLQSFTGRDSQIPVEMQHLFQKVHKNPPVLVFCSSSLWIQLSLETVRSADQLSETNQ